MGTISSGTGLISGLDISSIVNQLMAIESRPKTLLQNQVTKLTTIKTAWTGLLAKLQAVQNAAAALDESSTFQTVTATSSNSSVVTATATTGAAQGVYQITPVRLTSTHQLISAGLPDADSTPVGAGTLTLDLGHGRLDAATALGFLNGQAGVARGSIKITDRSGASSTVNLTTAMTVQDVLDAINETSGVQVTASVDGDRIVLTDTSGGLTHNLSVEEVGTGHTAAGLGILGSIAASSLTGGDVVSVNTNTYLSSLNDGLGVRARAGTDIKFTLEDGNSFSVDLSSANTVGDVLSAINNAVGNDGKLVAGIDATGDRITLTDSSGGSEGPLTVEAVEGSNAAYDLGLLGRDSDADHEIVGGRLVAGLNSVLLRNLNGGTGVAAGSITLQDRGTGSAVVDLSGAQTVNDVLAAINNAGIDVRATLNDVGNGIVITDTSGQTLRNLVIGESGSTTAADLHLIHDAADTSANSGSLGLRYISENSRLDALGVAAGKFIITDSMGRSATVDLTQATDTTLGKAIAEINSRGISVKASINDTGTGLLLTDTAGGTGRLKVAESGSTTAAELGILGSDSDGDGTIDGTRRITVTLDADDTLDDVAAAISASTSRVSASVINDGTGANGYRLVLTSKAGGQAGRIVLDPGTTGLSFATMSEAQDALAFLGDPSNPNAIALTSSSNTLSNVVSGVTFNLVGVSSSPATVAVSSSVEGVVSQVNSFVSAFNSAVSQIAQLTAYDSDTNTAAVLQGDVTANAIRSRMFDMILQSVSGATGGYSRLSQIGITIGSDGTQISFDADKLRQAWTSDPAGVTSLFTTATSGIGDRIESVMDRITDSIDGTITRQIKTVDDRVDMFNDQIERMTALLDARKARLTARFNAMESALASLQSQQSAISSLATLASSWSSYYSSGSSSSS